MLPQTHRRIGKLVFGLISKNSHIELHRIALEYGSVKPDIVPSLKSISHTKEVSFAYVQELILDMLDKPTPRTKAEIKTFSIRLGVILHFIADYFCHAHNDGRSDPLRTHYLYERKLAKIFDGKGWAEVYLSSWQCPPEFAIDSAIPLIEYIEKTHRRYLNRPHQVSMDIYFCVEVCMTVAFAIVSNRFSQLAADQAMPAGF